jgi:eukaryotic-like serine/threonine-protein kinase
MLAPVTSSRNRVSGPDSDDPEDQHAFLQGRVGLFGATSFILWLVIGVVSQGAAMIWSPPGAEMNMWPMLRLHFGVTLFLGLAWLATRFGRRPAWFLDAVDYFSPFVQGLTAALIMPSTVVGFRADLSMIMGYSFIAIARAAIIPSSALRTLAVSIIGSVPIIVATQYSYAHALTPPPLPPHVAATQAATWALLGAVLATTISRVIYGLRRKVQESARMGQYILERKIGEGGMGAVFRARHVLLRRPTAVKVLTADRAGDVPIARFEREVQLTAEISHPNIVAVYDYGRAVDGGFYYAMEYLDGCDLQRLVEEDGPQPPARVVHILSQAADALAEAHGVGLIHRDVKPGNIMLCKHARRPDQVKILDFGLVKQVDNVDATLSMANSIAGTPLYLSPEAITAPETIDGRSDLYALGAVGYFLLTGGPVFQGGTLLDLLARSLHDNVEAPSKRLGRALPEKLEALVMSCLARNRDDRPADAAAFRAALLACDDVGVWTAEEAKTWWAERPTRIPTSISPGSSASPFTATLAVAPRSPRS